MKTKRRRGVKRPESIVNNVAKLHATFEPGDVAHQGDLIIVCIRRLPASAESRVNRQLVEGGTQGSRHIMTVGEIYDCRPSDVAREIFEVTECNIGHAYIGPVFISPENPTCDDMTHPEHGNQGFPAGAVCAVVYQRSLDAEQREMRVLD